MHCHIVYGQGAMQFLHCTSTLLGGSARWNYCIAWGRGAVEPVQLAATLARAGGEWNSYNAPPHYPGAVGS